MMLIRNLAREPSKFRMAGRADVSWSSLLVPLSLPPSNDQGLAHGICGWTDGCGLTHRHGCCPAVLLSSQSQCSSHEAIPVASPSHSSHPLANITAFPERAQARGLPSSPPPTSRCTSEDQILQSHHGLHINLTVTFGDCCMSRQDTCAALTFFLLLPDHPPVSGLQTTETAKPRKTWNDPYQRR